MHFGLVVVVRNTNSRGLRTNFVCVRLLALFCLSSPLCFSIFDAMQGVAPGKNESEASLCVHMPILLPKGDFGIAAHISGFVLRLPI